MPVGIAVERLKFCSEPLVLYDIFYVILWNYLAFGVRHLENSDEERPNMLILSLVLAPVISALYGNTMLYLHGYLYANVSYDWITQQAILVHDNMQQLLYVISDLFRQGHLRL